MTMPNCVGLPVCLSLTQSKLISLLTVNYTTVFTHTKYLIQTDILLWDYTI